MKNILAASLVIASLLVLPATAPAEQFAVFGPRALGMGGASVAAVNDSTAVYWNPAALADSRKVDIRLDAGAAVRDYMKLRDKWDRIKAINDQISGGVTPGDLAAISELKQLLLDFSAPDAVDNIDVTGGMLVSFPVGSSALAVSALGAGYAELYPTIDTLNLDTTLPTPNIQNNNSAITSAGIVTMEPTVSFATSLGDAVLVGVNAKMVYAETFLHSEYLRSGNYRTFVDDMNNSRLRSNKASVDAGLLIRPFASLGIGVVGRYLNSPSFPVDGRIAVKSATGDVAVSATPLPQEIELKPQYRAGVAWKPIDTLTLSADYDLSKNSSFSERSEDQTAAAGIELTLLKEILSLRAGAYKNMANANANPVYTAGLGFRIFMLRLDLAGAYDFKKQEAQASLDLALRF